MYKHIFYPTLNSTPYIWEGRLRILSDAFLGS